MSALYERGMASSVKENQSLEPEASNYRALLANWDAHADTESFGLFSKANKVGTESAWVFLHTEKVLLQFLRT